MASIYPGVPNLLKPSGKAIGAALLGNLVTGLWNYLFPGPTWGVFKTGTTDAAIVVSSVLEVDISTESRVSDYIIQDGSFTTYNKVQMPDIVTIRMTQDGNDSERAALLTWLNTNKAATTFFDLLTPDSRYADMTLVGYRVSRSARSGAGMIIADCLFQQIRQNQAQFSNSKIADPENQQSTPTARAYAQPPDKPITVNSISWQ